MYRIGKQTRDAKSFGYENARVRSVALDVDLEWLDNIALDDGLDRGTVLRLIKVCGMLCQLLGNEFTESVIDEVPTDSVSCISSVLPPRLARFDCLPLALHTSFHRVGSS